MDSLRRAASIGAISGVAALLGFVFLLPKASSDDGGPSGISPLFATVTYVFYARNRHLRYQTWGPYAPEAHRGHGRSTRNAPAPRTRTGIAPSWECHKNKTRLPLHLGDSANRRGSSQGVQNRSQIRRSLFLSKVIAQGRPEPPSCPLATGVL